MFNTIKKISFTNGNKERTGLYLVMSSFVSK